MSMTSYIDDRYDDTFELVHENLENIIRKDPDSAESLIRGRLKSLYVRQGNDWTGRGAIGNAGLDATIAAHESLLVQLTSH
jgi:hypothetical protein